MNMTFGQGRAGLLAATMLVAPTAAFAQSDASTTAAPTPSAVSGRAGTQQVDTAPPAQAPRADALTPATESNDDTLQQRPDDIVVTGTLVRGVAPPGASPITADQRYIRSTGATTVAQVLQTIPQLDSFNSLQVPLAQSAEVSTNRPNLRNLPNARTFGGATTLILVDGHRLVGMGNGSTEPDPDVLPPGIIDRVEIVPDGGSAQYGSDAVAGVINFITLRRFNGVRADASYGFADHFWRYDAKPDRRSRLGIGVDLCIIQLRAEQRSARPRPRLHPAVPRCHHRPHGTDLQPRQHHRAGWRVLAGRDRGRRTSGRCRHRAEPVRQQRRSVAQSGVSAA